MWEYHVYINSKWVCSSLNEEEAWNVIESYPFGSLHAVYNNQGEVREEFIPY